MSVDCALFLTIGLISGVLWNLANVVQLIAFLPLLNVFLPYNVSQLFTILGFVNMDLSIAEDFLSNNLLHSSSLDNTPHNQRFS